MGVKLRVVEIKLSEPELDGAMIMDIKFEITTSPAMIPVYLQVHQKSVDVGIEDARRQLHYIATEIVKATAVATPTKE